jgi:hypothetical protein
MAVLILPMSFTSILSTVRKVRIGNTSKGLSLEQTQSAEKSNSVIGGH